MARMQNSPGRSTQVEASSDDQNSFTGSEAKFNPNALAKLSSPSEAMEKERGRAVLLRKKDQRAGRNPQMGQIDGHAFQRGKKNKMQFQEKKHIKKRKKGERLWNEEFQYTPTHHKRLIQPYS